MSAAELRSGSPTRTSSSGGERNDYRRSARRRALYLGPARSADLLEVVTVVRDDEELVIHAMKMRPKYRRLLPEADNGK